MKKGKKVVALLLCLLLTLSITPGIVAAEEEASVSNGDVVGNETQTFSQKIQEIPEEIGEEQSESAEVREVPPTASNETIEEQKVIAPANQVLVTKLKIAPYAVYAVPGEELDLTVEVTPSDATNQAVVWSSSEEAVATVDQDGHVKVLKPGKTRIYATAQDGSGVTCYRTITVRQPVPVTKLKIAPYAVYTVPGEELDLSVEVTPSNATEPAISWTSSDPSVATVDQNGHVKILSLGKTRIYAAANDGSEVTCYRTITVSEPVAITKLKIAPYSVYAVPGEELDLTVEVTPSNATNQKVVWSSSEEAVATVDQDGHVKVLKPGKTRIYATAQDGSGVACYRTITVRQPVPVTKLKIAPYSVYTTPGQELDLEVEITPSNATDPAISWTSSNPSVATVDQNGHVETHSLGTTRIYAAANDGSEVTCYRTITVSEPVAITKLKIAPYAVYISPAEELDLNIEVTPKNATNQEILWVSDNEYVATVDQNGHVTPHREGQARIYAYAQDGSNVYCYRTVMVRYPVTKLKIAPYSACAIVGEEMQFFVEVTPYYATNQEVTWRSDNPKVATVDEYGCVVAKAAGKARIYATAKDDSRVYCYRTIVVYNPLVNNTRVKKQVIERNSWAKTQITYDLNYNSYVNIFILDEEGYLVRTLREAMPMKAAKGRYATWNLKDDDGNYCPVGYYFAVVEAMLPSGEIFGYEMIALALVNPPKVKILGQGIQNPNGTAIISYMLNTEALVNIYIYESIPPYSAQGKLVYSKENIISSPGWNYFYWDCRDAKGKKLLKGSCNVDVVVQNSQGSDKIRDYLAI